ncbi:MAG: hypothetical protein B0A82_03025 [Alkalinema sp. CACIAM 70d]|nr:MAG: hypothetical protein B0A82_03025 [Alkalinema sp. CACIAM 70d]
MVSTQIKKPVLKNGATGADVKELQQLLNANTLNLKLQLKVDGQFGQKTRNAVAIFQHQVFQIADGIVGDRTWRALYKSAPVDMPTLKRGSKGDLVAQIQQSLKAGGFNPGIFDGNYGPQTEKAVANFQRAQGAPGSGVVDEETWYRISKFIRPQLDIEGCSR